MQFTKKIWDMKHAGITDDVYIAADAQFNALKEAMALNHLKYQENAERRFIVTNIINDEGTNVHFYINVDPTEKVIIGISILHIDVDSFNVEAVMRACAYVTNKMYIGSFCYDTERNVISFNWQTIWNEKQEPLVEIYDLLINRIGYAVESYYEHFQNVATGVLTYDDFVFEVENS